MNLTPVLTLLGVTVLLPCVPALSCRRATIETVRNASELPLEWKTGEKTCEVGEGCQDLVMLLENAHITTNLRVQGCMPQPDCNLLNGTKAIGTLDVSENCGLQLGE
ncbi:CD177 antigen [Cricetulus griseus]|uniref:CD177 antigen n=1 Tax=Cricetulus griseus TaxID=10029 RepID=G3IDT4_CRIGR|nr:CD177 antigen [Cricetulus griseus]